MTRCAGRATQGNVAAVVTEAFETWTKWRYIKQNSQRFNRCLFWAANQKKHFSSRRKIEHLNYGQVFVELDHWVSHNKPLGALPTSMVLCFAFFTHSFEGRHILVSQGACTAGAAPAPTANLRWESAFGSQKLDHRGFVENSSIFVCTTEYLPLKSDKWTLKITALSC